MVGLIINREDNLFIIKIYREKIKDINIYDIDSISDLFKDIIIKLKKKYSLNGICDIDVYVNDKYGMIIEVNNIYKYGKDLDVKISFHIDSYFMMEIDYGVNDINCYKEVYYYKNKYYVPYDVSNDCNVIYKECYDIINKGIRLK